MRFEYLLYTVFMGEECVIVFCSFDLGIMLQCYCLDFDSGADIHYFTGEGYKETHKVRLKSHLQYQISGGIPIPRPQY